MWPGQAASTALALLLALLAASLPGLVHAGAPEAAPPATPHTSGRMWRLDCRKQPMLQACTWWHCIYPGLYCWYCTADQQTSMPGLDASCPSWVCALRVRYHTPVTLSHSPTLRMLCRAACYAHASPGTA